MSLYFKINDQNMELDTDMVSADTLDLIIHNDLFATGFIEMLIKNGCFRLNDAPIRQIHRYIDMNQMVILYDARTDDIGNQAEMIEDVVSHLNAAEKANFLSTTPQEEAANANQMCATSSEEPSGLDNDRTEDETETDQHILTAVESMADESNNDIESDSLALLELLSSSSDDEDFEFEVLTILKDKAEIVKMRNFIEVVRNYTDKQFQINFRLERRTVYDLIAGYEASVYYPSDRSHGGKTPICAEIDVLSFIWFAVNKCSLRVVEQIFGIGITTAFRANDRVMAYLLDIAGTVIKFPENKEEAAADFFKVSGFPDVLGCIDGTSIHIRTPAHKIKSTYVNRHDVPSVTLQAICDVNQKFIDVCVGVPGKVHDARVLKLSDVSVDLQNMCNRRYHLLGDGAYPIREWLLVPFKDYGNLGMAEIGYNRKFCATRVLIENSFATLKGRFRQLINVDMNKVDKISKFVISCCVLHNLCIENGDFGQEVGSDEGSEQNGVTFLDATRTETDRELKMLGEIKRQQIMASFL